MPLFQQSVQKKFIKDLDKAKVAAAYQKLTAHFGNTAVQENIKTAKEEQYQEGFLRELFVEVFGYVLHPQPNYNLITEQKNEKNSKKADGAVLKNGKPIAVIELKSLKTTDLQAIEIQAFNYKANQTDCVYVITANFQKIRFYIENAVDFEEFDLFDLSAARFEVLYLCLHVDNVLSDLPLRIKQASHEREENITKKLYTDYSLFKQALFKDIAARNVQLDKLTLFKKTQKLLDRFLFVFFAEDKGLLPPNSVSEILNQWDTLKELDAYQPLYSRFKLYFGYLNSGHKGKNYDIFAYNGGLFAPDDLLDSFIITDNILYNHCQVLSHYDFDTEVDTNILGHIFEHSLNEMDEVAAHTEGVNLDKGKTKRKKDGIFYTPRYITKYIVESTIGELCKQKKLSLGIDNEALIQADTKKDCKIYQAKIADYRKWLLQRTILDPACGSGAFLNQALEFLLQEHRLIDTMTAMFSDDGLVTTDNVIQILENNIYGVDINEESVEIARLSLWLRTAKVGRKLNDLSRNIKCGNSLISDPAVAGDLAFDWQAAFPQVFEKGGFDVVIGNPPYGAKIPLEQTDYLVKKHSSYGISKTFSDTYFVFTVLALSELLKQNGILSYIMPNSWRLIESGTIFRKYLLANFNFIQIIQHIEKVFSDATVDCDTIVVQNNFEKENNVALIRQNTLTQVTNFQINQISLLENDFINLEISPEQRKLADKIIRNSVLVKDVLSVKNGVKPYEKGKGTPPQTAHTMLTKPFTSEIKIDDTFVPLIGGSYFNKYKTLWNNDYWISYGNWLAAPRDKNIFFDEQEKLIFRQTSDKLIGTLIQKGFVMRDNTHILLKINDFFDLKYVLAVLNSKLANFIYWTINPEKGEALAQVKAFHLGMLPLKMIDKQEQQSFVVLANMMLESNADFQKQNTRFLKLLQSIFPKITVNKKLETWYLLTFGEFRKELEKQKIVLPIKELLEYQDLFDTHATQLKALQTQIHHTEKAIDTLVYALYDLTKEEIALIEAQ